MTFPVQYNQRPSGESLTHENKTTNQNLPITVDPVTTEEGFLAFWTAYGGPLILVIGGFAAGFATLVIDRLRKKPSRPVAKTYYTLITKSHLIRVLSHHSVDIR